MSELHMAMEPECLEPLNLVIKKDGAGDDEDESNITKKNYDNSINKYEDNDKVIEDEDDDDDKEIDKDEDEIDADCNMTIFQDAMKSGNMNLPTNDEKVLTALYMSSLVQMSNMTLPRSVPTPATPSPSFNAQPNFMQLLAMVEARHRMWQHMSWNTAAGGPQNFIRNPLSMPPQPFFDNPQTSLSEQLIGSQNSTVVSSSPSLKHEHSTFTVDTNKQAYFKR